MPTNKEAKPVQLTPKQQIALMALSNHGGAQDRMDFDCATVLQHLGLVQKRLKFTPAELKTREQARKAQLRACIPLLRTGSARDIKKLRRMIDDIDSEAWQDTYTAYFLTAAGVEYLNRGTVTVTTGPTRKTKTAKGGNDAA